MGAVATALGLFFVGIQTYFTREQAISTEHEITTRLRPWVYRTSASSPKAHSLQEDKVTMDFVNAGQLAANFLHFYYIFKNEAISKKDVEKELLDQEPIIRERLLVPKEHIPRALPIDRSAFLRYGFGSAIYLHILVLYKYAGGDDEREGRYVGIFKIQKTTSTSSDYSFEIEKEWAK